MIFRSSLEELVHVGGFGQVTYPAIKAFRRLRCREVLSDRYQLRYLLEREAAEQMFREVREDEPGLAGELRIDKRHHLVHELEMPYERNDGSGTFLGTRQPSRSRR